MSAEVRLPNTDDVAEGSAARSYLNSSFYDPVCASFDALHQGVLVTHIVRTQYLCSETTTLTALTHMHKLYYPVMHCGLGNPCLGLQGSAAINPMFIHHDNAFT